MWHWHRAVLVATLVAAACILAEAARMTAAQKQAVLDAHNQCRCDVSPAATSMPAVTWDNTLETVSQAYVDTCPTGHNADRSTQYVAAGGSGYVGENLAWGYATFSDAVVTGWYGEKTDYTLSTKACSGVCGHYTQVVWAGTTRIACATPTNSCPQWGTAVYICNYAPGGNYVGQAPYTAGSGTNAACAAVGNGGIPATSSGSNSPAGGDPNGGGGGGGGTGGGGGSSSNAGAIAAGVIVTLAVVGAGAACFVKRRAIQQRWNAMRSSSSSSSKTLRAAPSSPRSAPATAAAAPAASPRPPAGPPPTAQAARPPTVPPHKPSARAPPPPRPGPSVASRTAQYNNMQNRV